MSINLCVFLLHTADHLLWGLTNCTHPRLQRFEQRFQDEIPIKKIYILFYKMIHYENKNKQEITDDIYYINYIYIINYLEIKEKI